MSKSLGIVRANFKARQEKVGELRAIDEAATGREYTEDEQAKVDELRSTLEATDTRLAALLEMETRGQDIDNATATLLGAIADRDSGEVEDTRSIGQRFVEADGFDEWRSRGARGNFGLDLDGLSLRAVTDANNAVGSAGAFQNPTRQARVGQDSLDRRTYLLDLIPHGTTSDNSIEYVQDVTPLADMADAAREVAEVAVKPQAGVTLAVKTDPVRTIAVWANITRQAAADNQQIMSYLDGRLRYAIKRRADKQVINGDGTGINLLGLLGRSGILSYAPVAAEARYRSIRHGIRMMEDAEAVPEVIVLNPADAELFDLSNDTTAGLHAVPDVANVPTARTAWGMRQVHSTAVAAGTAILLDSLATMVWDRQKPTAYMTDSHASNFTSNILTLLLEARAALTLFDPAGVLKLTFNGTV